METNDFSKQLSDGARSLMKLIHSTANFKEDDEIIFNCVELMFKASVKLENSNISYTGVKQAPLDVPDWVSDNKKSKVKTIK